MYLLWLFGLLHHPWEHPHHLKAIPLEVPVW